MEGVTEPCFRDVVLDANPPNALGGAFTEFVRVVDHPLPPKVLIRHLGPHRFEAPVGLQLMGANLDCLAETARRAVQVGAPVIDLNFGCPAKGAIKGCAGSAVLREPAGLERIVRACADVVTEVPVTAKIRAGFDDDTLIEELARAAEEGGASLLTVHCRTKAEGYRDTEDWDRLSRAKASVTIPVCGNGGVWKYEDLERLRLATGCEYAMVGRAALGDPWIFCGREVTASEAADFLLRYANELRARYGMHNKPLAGRLKQLLQRWVAGGLVTEEERKDWLRESDGAKLLERLDAARGELQPK